MLLYNYTIKSILHTRDTKTGLSILVNNEATVEDRKLWLEISHPEHRSPSEAPKRAKYSKFHRRKLLKVKDPSSFFFSIN